MVPWGLDNVISGSPILFEPFVDSAKFAAAYRNYHWRHVRSTLSNKDIEVPAKIEPYPRKSDHILDRPAADGGRNFGRLARTGIMDAYMQKLNEVQLCGIKSTYWREFLKTFQEGTTDEQARASLERLRGRVENAIDRPAPTAKAALGILNELEGLLDLKD